MQRTKEEMGEKLNDLLEKSYDAKKGFQTAADNVKNDRLRDFFHQKAEERKMFIKELREEITGYGQVPEDGGSASGKMHRTWMDMKSALSGNDEKAVLEESLKGEKAALEDYEDITSETDLPPTLSSKLSQQQHHIQNSINNVKMYEQMFD
ncbi:PA2169 family four-helix-bundle protein [Salegentibacter sp.]|uniref:ferritin-like domain-containing protein n=1 Tax=Salegentibacter sp. TaxID=1903072 RepID=UPI0035681BA6